MGMSKYELAGEYKGMEDGRFLSFLDMVKTLDFF